MGSPYLVDSDRESQSSINTERRRNPVRAVRTTQTNQEHRNIVEEFDYNHHNTIEEKQSNTEGPWDEEGNALLRAWIIEAKKESILHKNKGFYLKRVYRILGVSTIVAAALVFFTDSVQFSKDPKLDKTYHSIFAFINLVIVNINSFLSLGPKYQQHFEFEGRYLKVCIEMEEILATNILFRSPKDRTLAEYKEIVGNLLISAPEV